MESPSRPKRFEDLVVWQKAQEAGRLIYELTAVGAWTKDRSLKDQIRRAALSISSNIAEGQGRYSNKEFRRYLSIANGSTYEVISLIHFASGVGHITVPEAEKVLGKCTEISRMIKGLRNSISQ